MLGSTSVMNDFLYVDRIAVSIEYQNQNIGSILYEHVKKQAEEMECSSDCRGQHSTSKPRLNEVS